MAQTRLELSDLARACPLQVWLQLRLVGLDKEKPQQRSEGQVRGSMYSTLLVFAYAVLQLRASPTL